MIHKTDTAIVCPRGNPDLQPLVLDLTKIYKIQNRICEVAFVTAGKAPELLARFNEAFLDCHEQVVALEYELVQAKRVQNRIRAIIIIDKAPGILESKGLTSGKSRAGSEDLRNAVLDQDDDYLKACETVAQIECIIELFRGKMRGFQMAYESTKKILGESAFGMLNRTVQMGQGDHGAEVGTVEKTAAELALESSARSGFGKTRY